VKQTTCQYINMWKEIDTPTLHDILRDEIGKYLAR